MTKKAIDCISRYHDIASFAGQNLGFFSPMLIRRFYHHPLFPPVLVTLYFIVIGVVVYFVDYFTRDQIAELLMKWMPWNHRINFLCILAAVLFCSKDIRGALRSLLNRRGVLLAAVLLFGFSLVYFVAPRTHRIFFDEDIYANIAQNIVHVDKAGFCNYGVFEYDEYHPHWLEYNKQPSGWPFLISVVFQLFGTEERYAFLLNNLIFCGNLLLIFFICRHLTGRFFAGLMGALSFVSIPHNLTWSNTVTVEPSAVFFAGLTVLTLFVYLSHGHGRHLLLVALVLPFASQFRSESILIFFWVLLAFIVEKPRFLFDRKLWTVGLLTAIFLIPHILHMHAMGGQSWGAPGAKFSTVYFLRHLDMNGLYYLNNLKFPAILTLFFFAALFCRHCAWRGRLLILAWFLMFWGIFLFFYVGGYKIGADVRFALVSFMPFAVLAGIGGGCVRGWIAGAVDRIHPQRFRLPEWYIRSAENRKLASFMVILTTIYFASQLYPLVRQVGQTSWGSRHDHESAREFAAMLPERSIVLTHNPNMFLLWKTSAIQAFAGTVYPGLIKDLMKKYEGHVYFYYNYWCNTQDIGARRLCRAIMEKYNTEEIAVRTEQNYTYALYRLSVK